MKKLIITLVVLFMCASMVIGCKTSETVTTSLVATTAASGAAPTQAAPAPAQATPATSAAAADAPRYGGILKIRENLPLNVPFGDPFKAVGGMVNRTSVALERLFLPGDKAGTYKNVLATGFKLAPDKSYYDISVRQGVKFHDGTDFDAAAVKWNLDRVKTAKRPELQKVTSIEVIDDFTVRLNLSTWNNRILNDLLANACMMISPTAFEKNGADWINTHPVGTGPFVFKEIKNNQIIVFEKNTSYWEKGLPYLDGVELHLITDEMVAYAALIKGEVHFTGGMDAATAVQAAANPDLLIHLGNLNIAGVLVPNTVDSSSVWSDVRMRQALEYAMDKETLAKALSAYSEPIYNIIKGLEMATQENITPRKHDVAKARELMKAAGFPDGISFKIYIETAAIQGPFRNVTVALQQQLAEAGIKAEIVSTERAKMMEYYQGSMMGNDMRMQGYQGYSTTPIECVISALAESSGQYKGVKRPAEWPVLLEQAMQTEDPQKSLQILVKMDELAYNDAMFIPTATTVLPDAYSKSVQDLDLGMLGFNLSRTWLSKD
jgi:peptide/nickel transport system substrate-binding protein